MKRGYPELTLLFTESSDWQCNEYLVQLHNCLSGVSLRDRLSVMFPISCLLRLPLPPLLPLLQLGPRADHSNSPIIV